MARRDSTTLPKLRYPETREDGSLGANEVRPRRVKKCARFGGLKWMKLHLKTL